MVDLFTVNCTGWTNCLDMDNDRLNYTFDVTHENGTAPAMSVHCGFSSCVNMLLPVGDVLDRNRNQVTVTASNRANYTADMSIYPIMVGRIHTAL